MLIIIHIHGGLMRTVQMTIDEDLMKAVDRMVERLNTTRSAFARAALRRALRDQETSLKERKHRRGYEELPVDDEEFSVWEAEQEWGDR
jgi:metal-responsive CopG/Arc/MetJ family transcriptional regulator